MNGKGSFYWPDGKRYEGEYKNDLKHGLGSFIWLDKKWNGSWLFGKMDGRGTLEINGKFYNGEWRSGQLIR